jgi:hypothetical protein
MMKNACQRQKIQPKRQQLYIYKKILLGPQRNAEKIQCLLCGPFWQKKATNLWQQETETKQSVPV